jgi:hypothetical protein
MFWYAGKSSSRLSAMSVVTSIGRLKPRSMSRGEAGRQRSVPQDHTRPPSPSIPRRPLPSAFPNVAISSAAMTHSTPNHFAMRRHIQAPAEYVSIDDVVPFVLRELQRACHTSCLAKLRVSVISERPSCAALPGTVKGLPRSLQIDA